MSKAIDYAAVKIDTVYKVAKVIGEAEQKRYSVSKVYAAYNAATGKNDPPQTCSSCLRNRVKELRAWWKGYVEFVKSSDITYIEELWTLLGIPVEPRPEPEPRPDGDTDPTGGEDTPDGANVFQGALVNPEGELDPKAIIFTAGDGDPTKGTVKHADGTAVKPGKYQFGTDQELAVQPGGKAILKTNDLL